MEFTLANFVVKGSYNMLRNLIIAFSVLCVTAANALAQTPAPEGAKVYFLEPQDGAEVSNPVTIKFGLKGMGIAPAGVDKPNTGHHHILINQKLEDYSAPIPADDNHRHFGGGQTETTLELPAGKHTLQLVLGDQNHIPHSPPIQSQTITITVK